MAVQIRLKQHRMEQSTRGNDDTFSCVGVLIWLLPPPFFSKMRAVISSAIVLV
jgi:hypothetical protein